MEIFLLAISPVDAISMGGMGHLFLSYPFSGEEDDSYQLIH